MSVRGSTRGRKVRVAHVGTGATGQQALKGIIGHPDLELVSLWVSTPDKVGGDAGELVGMDGVGIAAVGSLEEALASKPDVLSYCANGLGREGDVVAEIATALERGIDVVTISLLGMLYPSAGPATLREPLEAAAAKGGSTFLSTGLDPGFSSDLLPMALLTMSDTVEHVLVQEIGIYDHYDVEPVIRGIMGFRSSTVLRGADRQRRSLRGVLGPDGAPARRPHGCRTRRGGGNERLRGPRRRLEYLRGSDGGGHRGRPSRGV